MGHGYSVLICILGEHEGVTQLPQEILSHYYNTERVTAQAQIISDFDIGFGVLLSDLFVRPQTDRWV